MMTPHTLLAQVAMFAYLSTSTNASKPLTLSFSRLYSTLHSSMPRFMHPLAAFVTSIGVTNVVSAFTETTLHRAGMMDQLTVDLCGAGFQLSIVLGGIVVGG